MDIAYDLFSRPAGMQLIRSRLKCQDKFGVGSTRFCCYTDIEIYANRLALYQIQGQICYQTELGLLLNRFKTDHKSS